MVKNFSRYIIEKKRQLVLDTVEKVCSKIGLETLPVNFEGCPEETGDHLAHIHTDTHKICISDFQLTKLNYDDIQHTIVHEITHVFEHGHGGGFQHTQAVIGAGTWEPKGKAVIRGGESNELKETLKSRNFNPNECRFHDCTEIDSLQSCVHCGQKFCSKHIMPKISKVLDIGSAPVIEKMDWERSGHACPEYFDYIQIKKREEDEKYGRALDALTGRNRRYANFGGSYRMTDRKNRKVGVLLGFIMLAMAMGGLSSGDYSLMRILMWVVAPILAMFAAYEQIMKGAMWKFFGVWLMPSILFAIMFGVIGFAFSMVLGVLVWFISIYLKK